MKIAVYSTEKGVQEIECEGVVDALKKFKEAFPNIKNFGVVATMNCPLPVEQK
jgi:hypothetical protein